MTQAQNHPQYTEDELLPLSVLADLTFCERRATLHLVEGIWNDNVFTVEGTHLHRKVEDDLAIESRGSIRIARGLRLRSLRLGLTGRADVVEFHRVSQGMGPREPDDGGACAIGIPLHGASGLWVPFPVEYKRGRLRHEEGYEVQLCAQAICLEEMLGVQVPVGAIYYGKPRRRLEVAIDDALRLTTETAAQRLHELVRAGATPRAVYAKKCDSCSLFPVCLPKAVQSRRRVSSYLERACTDLEGSRGK
jgi:CRISPR-associated exonuclease Cas4